MVVVVVEEVSGMCLVCQDGEEICVEERGNEQAFQTMYYMHGIIRRRIDHEASFFFVSSVTEAANCCPN